jgi:hypothetical protein
MEDSHNFENLVMCNSCPLEYVRGTSHSCMAAIWQRINMQEEKIRQITGAEKIE